LPLQITRRQLDRIRKLAARQHSGLSSAATFPRATAPSNDDLAMQRTLIWIWLLAAIALASGPDAPPPQRFATSLELLALVGATLAIRRCHAKR
jgi:hypothetical protein